MSCKLVQVTRIIFDNVARCHLRGAIESATNSIQTSRLLPPLSPVVPPPPPVCACTAVSGPADGDTMAVRETKLAPYQRRRRWQTGGRSDQSVCRSDQPTLTARRGTGDRGRGIWGQGIWGQGDMGTGGKMGKRETWGHREGGHGDRGMWGQGMWGPGTGDREQGNRGQGNRETGGRETGGQGDREWGDRGGMRQVGTGAGGRQVGGDRRRIQYNTMGILLASFVRRDSEFGQRCQDIRSVSVMILKPMLTDRTTCSVFISPYQ